MLNRKISFKKALGGVATLALLGATSFAQAAPIPGSIVNPMIVAGDPAGTPPDSPAKRVDPNVSTSKFSGVVSLYIQYPDPVTGASSGFICSGALVGKRQVISAGHCVDTNGRGKYIDLKAPGTQLLVLFNSNGSFGTPTGENKMIAASSFAVHKDYQGFNYCPSGARGCVNDDIALVTLSQDAPASAKIYKVANAPLTSGTKITMAGYGTTGNGITGANISPSFSVKRTGQNYVDVFDGDDEGKKAGNEVWYADFDAPGKDLWCDYADVCTPMLPNDVEAGIGPGDSGGPSFVEMYGELMVVANNTFGGRLPGYPSGGFYSYFGGMILSSYAGFLDEASGGRIRFVPEPASAALLGLGSLFLLGARRRRSAK